MLGFRDGVILNTMRHDSVSLKSWYFEDIPFPVGMVSFESLLFFWGVYCMVVVERQLEGLPNDLIKRRRAGATTRNCSSGFS